MPSKYGFQTEPELDSERKSAFQKALVIAKRINPVICDILEDWLKAHGAEIKANVEYNSYAPNIFSVAQWTIGDSYSWTGSDSCDSDPRKKVWLDLYWTNLFFSFRCMNLREPSKVAEIITRETGIKCPYK